MSHHLLPLLLNNPWQSRRTSYKLLLMRINRGASDSPPSLLRPWQLHLLQLLC
jgi:hypothetical protein